jgi:hypothetical protein
MRDFIKSTLRFSWAMSLFGVQQLENMVKDSSEQDNNTTTAFDSVIQATEEQLGGVIKQAFKAGERLQSEMVDTVFRSLPTGQAQPRPPDSPTPRAGSQPQQRPFANPYNTTTEVYPVYPGRLNTSSFIVLGEGLAAGMGNFTLIAETQRESFPAQMARQMRAEFPQPLIQPPGICDAVGFAQLPVRVPAQGQTTVLDPLPSPPAFNLSVPGFKLSDALNLRPVQPLVHRSDAKQTAVNLILGERPIMNGQEGALPTQLESALERRPSLAIIELGYYEVLEAAIKGDLNLLPDVGSFRSDYARLLKTLQKSGSELIVLTIPDPIDTAHFSTVEVAAKILKVEPPVIERLYNLRDGDHITVNGLIEIGCQLLAQAIKPLPDGSVLSAEVAIKVRSRVEELNGLITALAQERRARLYDLHAFFRRIANEGVFVGSRRLTGEFLGGFYSLNGYYPGQTGHALIANELLHLLNSSYGADFPEADARAVVLTDPVAAYRQAAGSNWASSQLPQIKAAPEPSVSTPGRPSPEKHRSHRPASMGWDELGLEQPSPAPRLQLPPGLEQVLPLSKAASYFGDAIRAMNCVNEKESQYGSCGVLLFGGLAMVDSHLDGYIRLTFSEPVDDITHFEVTHGDGLVGDDGVLAAPQFFRLPVLQNRVQDISGLVSSGDLNLKTGQVTNLNYYVRFSNTALLALARVNPKLPDQPISFPGQYGSAWAQFEQRPDGNLDFTFYGSTFLPLGSNFQGDPVLFPLPIAGPTLQFASIPGSGTALHPHLALSTKEPKAARGLEEVPSIPFNTIQELTLFTHNSSFGDAFGLDIVEWGGVATGRSHVLGRVQLQFGERAGNSVPVAVYHLQPGGFLAPFPATPVTDLFPASLPPGPIGFNEFLRFPLRTYSLNDLAILDDPFDISVGSVDLSTGETLLPLLHRAFINQDLIFALIRIAPETAKTFFLFRGPARLEKGMDGQPVFRFQGSILIPYPAGLQFPKPDLATGYTNLGKEAFLDPFLWIHAIQDSKAAHVVKKGSASKVLASTGDRFSYSYLIPSDPAGRKALFEYDNHTQQGKFRLHSLAWIGFSNSGTSRAKAGESDTVTFTGYGIWSKGGVNSLQQAAVQVSTSPERPYVGIQIGGGFVSNVNTKPPNPKDALP